MVQERNFFYHEQAVEKRKKGEIDRKKMQILDAIIINISFG